MPDISKCLNSYCPSRFNCYRFTSIGSNYQTYANFKVEEGQDKCDYFWDNKYNKEDE